MVSGSGAARIAYVSVRRTRRLTFPSPRSCRAAAWGDKIGVQRDFSTKECRDKFPVGADPSFSVIKAYDAALNIPLIGPAFANRISYVISPEGKIVYAYSHSHAEKH